ncbi:cyclophilin-like fold protein [Paenibacillus sp. CC-CFT747]|nr:cyclophilin-like fold protein [Paenibacillus sp. CC-CFT747]
MIKGLDLLLALVMVASLAACGGKEESSFQANQPSASSNQENQSAKEVRLKLIMNPDEFIVKMYDNPTSRDFLSRLPLTLTFKEFGGFEKLTILEKELSTEDAPPGSDPEVGDLGYYAPWKDVNLYYKDWSYSSGLVKLGKIESGLEDFTKKLQDTKGDFTVTIQKID